MEKKNTNIKTTRNRKPINELLSITCNFTKWIIIPCVAFGGNSAEKKKKKKPRNMRPCFNFNKQTDSYQHDRKELKNKKLDMM